MTWFSLSASAQDQAPAMSFKERYERAVAIFKSGQYDQAIEEFQAVYQMRPLPLLLFNLAQAHRKAGHLKEALDLFERFLREDPKTEIRPETEGHINDVKRLIEQQKLAVQRMAVLQAQHEKLMLQAQHEKLALEEELMAQPPPAGYALSSEKLGIRRSRASSSSAPAGAGPVKASFRTWVSQQGSAGRPLAFTEALYSGDRFAVSVILDRPAYVYVVLLRQSGRSQVLFPRTAAEERPIAPPGRPLPLSAILRRVNRTIRLPSKAPRTSPDPLLASPSVGNVHAPSADYWGQMANVGLFRLYFVVSEQPIAKADRLLGQKLGLLALGQNQKSPSPPPPPPPTSEVDPVFWTRG